LAHHAADGRVIPRGRPSKPETFPAQHRKLKPRLHDASQDHANSQPEDLSFQGLSHPRRDPKYRADHDHVEHGCAYRRDEEVSSRIEHPHEDSGQTDEKNVGKHPSQEAQHQLGLILLEFEP